MEDFNYIFLVFASYFIGSVIFSIIINFIFLQFAQNLGIRAKLDTANRWSLYQKPSFGGISFYIIFLLSFTSYAIFFSNIDAFPNRIMFGLIAATALAFLMGLADDAFNTRPMLKLGIQILSSLILIYTGTYIHLFDSDWLNYTLTIIWVVGIMNSINMLDNMDAVTAVVSIVILLTTIIIMSLTGNYVNIYYFTLLGVLASLIGFLFFNWYPSKLFMGDTGSQFLGVFLAFVGIRFFWNASWAEISDPIAGNFIIIMAIFALPLIDTSTVVINRILRGQSPMIGGKDHTTHSLTHAGFSDKQVALIFGLISSMFSLMVIYGIAYQKDSQEYLEIGILVLFLIVFSILFILNRSYLKYTLKDA
jgi:UDP-GlcNAc:undecaprenyl-phosphate GlcNAc-1-phosphate transferase